MHHARIESNQKQLRMASRIGPRADDGFETKARHSNFTPSLGKVFEQHQQLAPKPRVFFFACSVRRP